MRKASGKFGNGRFLKGIKETARLSRSSWRVSPPLTPSELSEVLSDIDRDTVGVVARGLEMSWKSRRPERPSSTPVQISERT
jgi:hypothetical protein